MAEDDDFSGRPRVDGRVLCDACEQAEVAMVGRATAGDGRGRRTRGASGRLRARPGAIYESSLSFL